MSNDPKQDLIYAILAMDSYNRGYGSGISDLDDVGDHAKIGLYSVVQNISQSGWFDAGFYAIAYKKGNDTVIAYRGTDVKGPFSDDNMGGSDPLNGYGMALGSTSSQQGILAAQFYRAVTGVAIDSQSADGVVLTGHSLGGGLAGYIGSV